MFVAMKKKYARSRSTSPRDLALRVTKTTRGLPPVDPGAYYSGVCPGLVCFPSKRQDPGSRGILATLPPS